MSEDLHGSVPSNPKNSGVGPSEPRPRRRIVFSKEPAAPTPDGTLVSETAVTDVGELVRGESASDPDLNWVTKYRLSLVYRRTTELVASNRQARRRSKAMVASLRAHVKHNGLINPLIVAGDRVVVGHGRLEAALAEGIEYVPTIDVSHLTEDQRRLYAIAENKIAEMGGWNEDVLREEMRHLYSLKLDFDLRLATGSDSLTFDQMVLELAPGESEGGSAEDAVPPASQIAVSRIGDVFTCGDHVIFCGSATDPEVYAGLFGDETAQMVFGDPPWGVPITGHVGNKGKHKHREFVSGGGDMTAEELLQLFVDSQRLSIAHSKDGALHFWCIDWAHLSAMLEAGAGRYSELKNIIVWVKPNSGLGSCYRSQHEMIVLQKVGTAPHVNNFGLGEKGRVRSNCWFYPGANSFGKERDEMLSMHPTVKPLAMIVDAILDCSHQGDIVLDPFGGSGTTMIAAEKTKRRARLIELDPLYVDTAIRRWQAATGRQAIRQVDGKTFDEIAASSTIATESIDG